MAKSYSPPAVIDYGSIADCTFVTPAITKKYGIPTGSGAPAAIQPGGQYTCTVNAGVYTSLTGQPGGKNYIVLQCDKFGEYSHS